MYGGPGAEREVSVRSGQAVAAALASLGREVIPVELHAARVEVPEGTDLVFNMIHGTFGEDGELQAQLDSMGVPYTGEGAAASRTAFDKILSKRAFEAAGVATPEWKVVGSNDPAPFEAPFVVKAPRQGSSVGVHILRDAAGYGDALRDCLQYGDDVLVEKFFAGRELTIGVLGREALPIIEIRPKQGFYDYQNKYTKGATDYLVPAPLDAAVAGQISDLALAAYRAIGLEVYARVDILLDGDGNGSVLEINTIPGMTETSLLPKAAAVRGMGFAELCERIGVLSLNRRASWP